MMVQIQNIMANKILRVVFILFFPILTFGQARITWDNQQDQSRVLLYYPADSNNIKSSVWYETIKNASLVPKHNKSLNRVSGANDFYTAPYTIEPRYGLKLDTTTLVNKGGITYTGDSLSVYFALRMNADQENTVGRLISLVDTSGVVGDNNSLSVWLHNGRLQVSSNGKLVTGSSKYLNYKVYLVEVHVNDRGAVLVLDGDTLHHNREFVPYQFNINGIILGSDYVPTYDKPAFSPSYSANIERLYIEGVDITESGDGITTWADQSGNGYDATNPGNEGTSPQLTGDRTLEFDGTDDYLILENPLNQTDATVFTVVFPKPVPADGDGTQYLFGYSTSFGDGAPFFHPTLNYDSSANKIAFRNLARITVSPSTVTEAVSDTIYDPFKNYLVTNVYDESDSIYLFVNGDSVASAPTDGEWAGTSTNARLGSHQEGFCCFFKGEYKMLLWYNRKLTPAEQDIVEDEINDYLDLYGALAAQPDYVNDIVLGDLMITEGPLDWVREAFNEKYHVYEDINYEELTSIAEAHPVKLLLDLKKLDSRRFNFVNDGRHTQNNYYYGLNDTLFSSDLVGLDWHWTPGVPGYTPSEDSRFRSVHFNGDWILYPNGTSSYYYNTPLNGASIGGVDTSYTLLTEFGQAYNDNNPQSQLWPIGTYYHEDVNATYNTTTPNYTYSNNAQRRAFPYYPEIYSWEYDTMHIAGYTGRYYDSDNTEMHIYHNGAGAPMTHTIVDPASNTYAGGFWWVRSTPNNLFWPARWAKLVGFEGQLKWREANYLMRNWGRIDFTNQYNKPISNSFIHEYEASADYLTVKPGTDTLSVWQDRMGRIDIVDTTTVGYDNNTIGVATVDTVNYVVQCRENRSFYIPFDSSHQYDNVNVYLVLEDLSTGTDTSWIGLIHTGNASYTDEALLRWSGAYNAYAYRLGDYTKGASVEGQEYFKGYHQNYFDHQYWPRWNLSGSGASNRYNITIDDPNYYGDGLVTNDSIQGRKLIMMLEGVNANAYDGLSMSWQTNNANGNFDIKHVVITHGEENPQRVFTYLHDKYDGWVDDRYTPGLLDPNATDYLVSYDISELIDTATYPVAVYFDFDDTKMDYGNAVGGRVKNTFDRVNGYIQTTGVGGNPDYYLRTRDMLGETVTAMGYNTGSYSFGRWNWQGAITDTSYTVLTTIRAIDFGTSNLEGFMSLITGNTSVGAWWNTSGGTSDQGRLRINGTDKWTWSGMDDTLSVMGFSINKNSALRGVRYVAGQTTNSYNLANTSSASATIDFDAGSLAITMAADSRGANGTPGVDYYDKFIALDGALGSDDLNLVTRFLPKLRIEQYPAPELLSLRPDLVDDAIHVHDKQWGRRQDNSVGSNTSSVRWWYNYDSGGADIQQGTEDDRPTSINTGGVSFDGNDHMDITTLRFAGTDPGHCACVVFEFTDTTASTLYLWDIATGNNSAGDDFYHAMRATKLIGANAYLPFSNYRDEPTVMGISARMTAYVGEKNLLCHNLDEDGWAELWFNGIMVNKDALDGSFYGADFNRVFGSKRVSEVEQFTGNMYGITMFDRNLTREEMKSVNDSLMSHYGVTPKTVPDLSYDPFTVWNPKTGVHVDGNGVRTIPNRSSRRWQRSKNNTRFIR